MRKADRYLLLAATAVFALVLAGIFFFRISAREDIPLSKLPQTSLSTDVPVEERGKVNINTADIQELTILPGISETIAARIIAYREEHGDFLSIYDITQVEGIGSALLLQIQDYITVGG